jgi:hypothetical protein
MHVQENTGSFLVFKCNEHSMLLFFYMSLVIGGIYTQKM